MSIKRLVPLNTVSLTADPSTAIAGDIYYNSTSSQLRYFNGTSWIVLAGSANSLVYAKSIYQDVRNQSGATIPIGTPVYISGAIGASGKILISPASNASEATSSKTMAITTSAISNNSNGQIISEGLLEGIDTTGASDGDPVWLGVNGAKIYGLANKPAAPAHLVFLGIVVNGGSANAGSIFVKIQNGFELEEIHNVSISSLLNGNILAYDSTTSTWKNTNTLQSTASTVPLIIKGAASQTANLQEWQDSAGIVLVKIQPDGAVGVNGTPGTNTKFYIEESYTGNGGANTGLRVRGTGSSTGNWKGRIIAGGDTVAFLMGEYGSQAWLGGHNAALNAWAPFYINPDGTQNLYLGNTGVGGSTPIVTIQNSNGSVGIGTSSATAKLHIVNTSASAQGLIVKGAASQTAKLQEWQNSAGTVVASTSVEGNGYFQANLNAASIGAGNNIGGASLTASPWSAATTVSIIRGYTSQTADLTQWQNSAGTVLASINPNGGLFIKPTSTSGNLLKFENTGNAYGWSVPANDSNAIVFDVNTDPRIYWGSNTIWTMESAPNSSVFRPYSSGRYGLTVKGLVSQTGALQHWQNSSGTTLVQIGSGGDLFMSSATRAFFGGADMDGYVNISTSGNAARQGIVIKAAASQTANLQEWQNNSGTVLSGINPAGQIHTGTTTSINGSITGEITSATKVSSTVATFGYTGTSLVQVGQRVTVSSPYGFYDGTGFSGTWTVTAVTSNTFTVLGSGFGYIVAPEAEDGIFTLSAAGSFVANTALTTPVAVRGVASQTANLQEWQNASGTVLAKVDASGNATAASFVKTSGTSSQFLKADGSVDSSTYLTTGTASSTYLPLTGGTVSSDLTVTGNFTVNGTTTNLNSTNLVVEDKNIIVADVTTPTDTTADGAGITIKGATDKTLNWVQSTGSFTSSEPFIINTTSTTKQNLIIKAIASQTANLQEWQNSSGTVLTSVDKDGYLQTPRLVITNGGNIIDSAGTTPYFGFGSNQITIYARNAAYKPLVIQGAASQSVNLQEWQDASSAPMATMSPSGQLRLNSVYNIGSFNNSQVNMLTTGTQITSNVASNIILSVKAATSQTANLQEWQNSTGTALVSISSDGVINKTGTTNIGPVLTFANPGVGQDTRFNFTKSSDAAWLSVVERANDSTYYEFGMSDNPTASDYFQWKFDNYESAAQGWMPLQMGAMATRFTSDVSNWGSYSIPVNTPFTTLNQSETSNADFQVNKYAPTNNTAQVLNKDSGTGTGTVTLNAQSFSNTFRLGYWIRIDAGATTFSWGYGFTSNAPVATGVAITGSAQTLGSGVTVTLSLTNHVAGDSWSFLCFPRPTVGIGGAPLLTSMHTVYPSAAVVGSIIKGAVSQTANLQEWQDSAGTGLTNIDSTGRINSTIGLYTSGKISVGGASWSGGSAMLNTWTTGTATVGHIIRGVASQTADLQQWQDSAASVIARITSAGGITVSSNITQSSSGRTFIGGAADYGAFLNIGIPTASRQGIVVRANASQTANLEEWQNNAGTVLAKVDATGNFSAISKSFDIPHPTKENMRLRYASLEGNEHGVYVRGITKENVIELPEYWTELVDESTITVSLTSIGKFQKVYVEKIEGNKIYIGGRVKEISYAVFGERKDIDKLIVEY